MKKKYITLGILSLVLILIVLVVLSIIFQKPEGISYSALLSIKEDTDLHSYGGILIDFTKKEDDNFTSGTFSYEVIDHFDFITYNTKDVNVGSVDLWINTGKARKISLLFTAATFPCCDTVDVGLFPVSIEPQDLKIVINGKKLPSTLNEKKQRRTEINYTGKKEATYNIDISWRGGYKLKGTIHLHWLEPEEFEKLKAQKLQEFEKSEP